MWEEDHSTKSSRYTAEQIAFALRQSESGMSVLGVSEDRGRRADLPPAEEVSGDGCGRGKTA